MCQKSSNSFHFQALRLLVGRGGDPDRCDNYGNTALHLASARGNMQVLKSLIKMQCRNCTYIYHLTEQVYHGHHIFSLQVVTFLINFGVNIYALDIDMHTAQELAAINNADNVLRYLDAVVAKVVCIRD